MKEEILLGFSGFSLCLHQTKVGGLLEKTRLQQYAIWKPASESGQMDGDHLRYAGHRPREIWPEGLPAFFQLQMEERDVLLPHVTSL